MEILYHQPLPSGGSVSLRKTGQGDLELVLVKSDNSFSWVVGADLELIRAINIVTTEYIVEAMRKAGALE